MKSQFIILLVGFMVFVMACTKDKTDTYDRFNFRNDGVDLAVEINGNIKSGTFVLLLHGGPGGGAEAYNSGYYAQELEKEYAMVYMNQRGNGSSSGDYEKEALTIAKNSSDIYQLVLFLKARYGQDISVILMGHSWGGLTGTHALVTTDLQEEVKAWIEVDGAHDFRQNDIEAVKLFLEIGYEELAANRNTDFWQPVIDRVSEMDTNNINNEAKGFLNSKAFEAEGKLDQISMGSDEFFPPPYLINSPNLSLAIYMNNQFINPILNQDSENNPLTSSLHKIKIPCLFAYGKYDLVVPPAIGEMAFELVDTEEKELIIFEASGHSPMNNEPELFVSEISRFIELYK